ncbi:MAG: hypothetical protein ACYCTW_11470 [Sulfuricella sp.]
MKTTPNTASSFSLHPALWIAGISVTLLSLVGISFADRDIACQISA